MILTFFLLSLGALFLGQWTGGWTTKHLFCVYRGSLKDPLFYIRLFGHVLGHASWDHFLNNMLLLLVIGPPMEEKYGSGPLLKGILLTALISGVLQCVLFPHTALLGASGIVFMLIMLASLSGFSGGIPVTMLLVAALYLGQQVYDIIFAHDNVANFMHIVGGVCGTAFGYVYAMLPRKRRRPAARKSDDQQTTPESARTAFWGRFMGYNSFRIRRAARMISSLVCQTSNSEKPGRPMGTPSRRKVIRLSSTCLPDM